MIPELVDEFRRERDGKRPKRYHNFEASHRQWDQLRFQNLPRLVSKLCLHLPKFSESRRVILASLDDWQHIDVDAWVTELRRVQVHARHQWMSESDQQDAEIALTDTEARAFELVPEFGQPVIMGAALALELGICEGHVKRVMASLRRKRGTMNTRGSGYHRAPSARP